jgi:predicted ester cyclase
MSTKSNKALIRRYFKAIDAGDVSVLDEYVSPAFIDHSPSPGESSDLEGLKRSFLASKIATPGYHHVDDLVAEGDKVVARVTGYGTHEGTYRGIPATGKKVRESGIVIWRIRRGKIVERWAASHTEDLMRQIQAPKRSRK